MKKTLLIALGLALASLALAQEAADPVFVAADLTPLYADAAGAEEAAQLRITTPLERLEAGDGRALVRVVGWIQAEDLAAGGPLYTNPVDGVEVSPAAAAASLTELGSEGAWHQVELRGWVSDEALVADREAMFATAAKTYQRYCSRCHTGYAGPVEDLIVRLKPFEWPEIAGRMASGTGIAKADLSLVVHWLQTESQAAHAAPTP